MAKRSEYLKALKRKYQASENTLNTKLDSLDLPALEDESGSEFNLQIIDPPIVKGVDLRIHPVPALREYYNNIFELGGKIAGVFDKNGELLNLVTRSSTGGVAKTPDDFAGVKRKIREGMTFRKVFSLIDDDFEYPEGRKSRKARPKQMSPDDFWEQFPPNIREKILESELPQVVEFVTYVNNQTVVSMKDKEIKKGIRWLRKNRIIRKSFFREIEDSD